MFKRYYQLTKPGIVYGNALTAAAGFLLAAKGQVNFWDFVSMLTAVSLVIASACVFNNYLDRGIDAKMARTAKRALVIGEVSATAALSYGTALAGLGFTILVLFTNSLTVAVGIVAWVDYVILYGIGKRKTVHGTIIGSIAGAAPIVAGYTAAANSFDTGAIILGLILVLWQMPHFYAIALFRQKDYAAANIPVLPIVSGVRQTKLQIVAYMIAFMAAVISLSLFGYAGYTYLSVMIVLCLWWLVPTIRSFQSAPEPWARTLFFRSLIVIAGLSVMLSVGSVLP